MSFKRIFLISFFLITSNCFSQSLFSKVFGANDYDECILLKIDSKTSNYAAKLIQKSCRKKFPIERKKSRENKEDQLQRIPRQVVNEKFKDLVITNNSKDSSSMYDVVTLSFINKSKCINY